MIFFFFIDKICLKDDLKRLKVQKSLIAQRLFNFSLKSKSPIR